MSLRPDSPRIRQTLPRTRSRSELAARAAAALRRARRRAVRRRPLHRRPRSDDPRIIVIDAEVDAQARQVFKEARGREPNADELYALRRVWLDNEVLYREGLALQLDKGDPAIRERVIFKALSVVDAGTKLPPFDDTVLREWFEKQPREVRRAGALRLPGSGAGRRHVRSRGARVRRAR